MLVRLPDIGAGDGGKSYAGVTFVDGQCPRVRLGGSYIKQLRGEILELVMEEKVTRV